MKHPLLNGMLYKHNLGDWEICWESSNDYRHWCTQVRTGLNSEFVLVQMFNPGSLNGDGKNLRRDLTLRTLRDVFERSSLGCLVINLFDYATPNPGELFKVWHLRDRLGSSLVYNLLPMDRIVARIVAYGDYQHYPDAAIAMDIKTRIAALSRIFGHLPLIATPVNPSGTPKHVRRWQLESQKAKISETIATFDAKRHTS